MDSYYYIGHFSKFIGRAAKRIISSSTTDTLLTTAFLNPDGKIAVVVVNLSDSGAAVQLLGGREKREEQQPRTLDHDPGAVVELRRFI